MRLSTNFKVQRDLDLSRFTVVSGPNMAGKTALIQSLELVLTGKLPGIRAKSAYQDRSAVSGDSIQIHLTSESDDWRATFKTFVNERGTVDTDHEILGFGVAALPITDVGNVLAEGDDRRRDSIIARFGPKSTSIPTPSAILGEMLTEWHTHTAGLKKLVEVQPVFDKLKRKQNTLAADSKARIEQYKAKFDKDAAGSELLPRLKRELDAALADNLVSRTSSELYESKDKRIAELTTEIAVAQIVLDAATKNQTDYTAQKLNLVPPRDEERKKLQAQKQDADAIVAGLRVMERHGMTQCICSNPISVPALLKDYQDAATSLMKDLNVLSLGTASYQQHLAALNMRLLKAETDIRQATAAITSKTSAIEELQKLIAPPPVTVQVHRPVEDVKRDIELIERAVKLRADIEEEEARLFSAEQKSELYKTLEKQAKKLEAKEIADIIETVETAVRKYIGKFQVRLATTEGGAVAWEMLGGDNKWHKKDDMTGAQKAALIVAIALAWAEGKKFRVVLLDMDDLPKLDKINFINMLQAIEASGVDLAVVTSTEPITTGSWQVVAV